MKFKIFGHIALGILLGGAFQPSAFAQDDKALARAQFMLRQVNAEKAQVQQQLTQLQQEFDAYKAQAEKDIAALEKSQRKLKGALGSWKEGHENVSGELQQTQEQLLRQSEKGEILKQLLVSQTQNFEVCKVSNTNLVEVNEELLTLYKDKGFSDVFRNREPMTGLAKVKVENILQDYGHKVDDNNLKQNQYKLDTVEVPEFEDEKPLAGSNGKPLGGSGEKPLAESNKEPLAESNKEPLSGGKEKPLAGSNKKPSMDSSGNSERESTEEADREGRQHLVDEAEAKHSDAQQDEMAQSASDTL